MPRAYRHPLFLYCAIVMIAVVSLSLHVVMLQIMHIPFPNYQGVGIWGLLEPAGRALGLILVYRILKPALPERFISQALLIALVDAMITEKIRLGVMFSVTTASLAFPAISLGVELMDSLRVGLLVVTVGRLVRNPPAQIAGAVAITTAFTFLVAPIHDRILAHFAFLERPEIYTEPYGPVVLTISYALFVMTAAASFFLIRSLRPKLSTGRMINWLQSLGIVFLIRGTLIAQIIFPWLATTGRLRCFTDSSQFFLQDLMMISCCWLLAG